MSNYIQFVDENGNPGLLVEVQELEAEETETTQDEDEGWRGDTA